MNLYLLTPNDDSWSGYYIFEMVVVAAKDEKEARMIHPHHQIGDPLTKWWERKPYIGGWPDSPDDITAEKIGVAVSRINEPQVILSSYIPG